MRIINLKKWHENCKEHVESSFYWSWSLKVPACYFQGGKVWNHKEAECDGCPMPNLFQFYFFAIEHHNYKFYVLTMDYFMAKMAFL